MKKTQSDRYYHERFNKALQFIVNKDKKVLVYGFFSGSTLLSLKAEKSIDVEENLDYVKFAKRKYPKANFVYSGFDKYTPREKFDYVILVGTIGKSKDIGRLLKNVQKACRPGTRVIIYQHNFLWQTILQLLEKLGLKRKEGIQNWLSVPDIKSYLQSSGFEATRMFRRTLIPAKIWGLGPLINTIAAMFPLFDYLKLDQFIIARPKPKFRAKYSKSLTICLTVRNEKGNIEKIIKSIPKVCKDQEILFVEGHSTDGTRKEIERVARLYPQKKVRVIGQPGKGQGDAIRVGFKEAKGEIIILYEGDGTSDPRDIPYFYDTLNDGTFEFIEGSRFVYPLDRKTMPLLNQIGNTFFAKWFSFFLGQHTTDVLSGIKAILKRDYEILFQRWGFLGLEDPFGDFELLYGAARMGLKFGEIPMHYYPRAYGKSKTRLFVHGPFLLRMALKGYWLFRKA